MAPGAKAFKLKEVLPHIALPPCPAVFGMLSSALDADAAIDKISKTISIDQVLTVDVLKVANSAFYGANRSLRSVDEAIMRLGFDEIKTIALGLKSKDMFKTAKGWVPFNTRLWNHSLATGTIMRALSRRINPRFGDVFFTAGILHDFGKLILQQGVPGYVELIGVLHGRPLVLKERQSFGSDHAEVGGELLQMWKLPETLIKLTAGHHSPIDPGDSLINVRRLLSASNEMAHALESGPAGTIGFSAAPVEAIMAIADLTPEDWNQALTSCQRQFNALKS